MKKTVLITGASRGIGKATAELFATNGYNVIVNYNNSESKAFELCKRINATPIKANIANHDDISEMFSYINKNFGGVDILVNNASISIYGLVTDFTEADIKNLFDINVFGTMLCTKEALPHMIHNKFGKIINVSSMWGITGASCEVYYSSSKASIIGYTKALAKEVAPSGINVNCVAPGVVQTDMIKSFGESDLKILCEETPLGRIATPSEIAQTILFLASDNSTFITGEVINVNGGYLI